MSGTMISHYEILDKLGSGGMGEVFKAHDKRLNRFVAIKVLTAARSGAPQRRRRFLQEAQSASALNHPSIITIHDILDEGETQYLVMEYVTGKTLHASIPSVGMRIAQVLQYSAQMADALSVAHAAGIVHRDFKPANVMITPSGLVKVLDFGLAKLTERTDPLGGSSPGTGESDADSNPDTQTQSPLTTEGSILGTVNYMSPEQAEGKQVDARSDIFSFGAVMYEMVTGTRAFDGDSDIMTLTAVLRDDVKPIGEVAPEVPPELEQVIKVCLEKDPELRWQSMREVEMALSGLKRRADAGALHKRSGNPLSAPPSGNLPRPSSVVVTPVPAVATPPPPAPKSNAGLLIAAAAGVVILAVAAGVGWWWSRQHQPAPVAVVTPHPTPQPVTAPPPSVPEPAPSQPAASQQATPEASAPADAPIATPKNSAPAAAPRAPRVMPVPPPPSATPPASAAAPTPPPVAPLTPKPDPARNAVHLVAVDIAEALPLRIALAEDVPADAEAGRPLSFRVLEDLKIGDTVLIARGATVSGTIAGEGGKRFLGIGGGKMMFELDSVEAVSGQKIKVRAAAARKANGPTTRQIDTGKYAKAKDLAAARGTDYIAYIDGDQTVSVKK